MVNTVSSTLWINTWKELPQHGTEFWVPANLTESPQVWPAYDSSGNFYDISDDFGAIVGGTVSISNEFAFIFPMTAQITDWVYDVKGDGIGPEDRLIGGVVKPTRVGWGGFARQEVQNGPFVFYTSAIDGESAYNGTTMPRLPVEDPNTTPFTNALIASLDGTVVVTSREMSPSAATAVPEASALLSVGLAGSLCGLGAWLRKRNAR